MAVTIASAYENNTDQLNFLNFISKYNKVYKTVHEFEARLKTFVQTVKEIEQSNTENANFTLGVNQFADLTAYEMRVRLGRNPGSNKDQFTKTFSADDFSEMNQTEDEWNWCD